jgi:hypothetical protein
MLSATPTTPVLKPQKRKRTISSEARIVVIDSPRTPVLYPLDSNSKMDNVSVLATSPDIMHYNPHLNPQLQDELSGDDFALPLAIVTLQPDVGLGDRGDKDCTKKDMLVNDSMDIDAAQSEVVIASRTNKDSQDESDFNDEIAAKMKAFQDFICRDLEGSLM